MTFAVLLLWSTLPTHEFSPWSPCIPCSTDRSPSSQVQRWVFASCMHQMSQMHTQVYRYCSWQNRVQEKYWFLLLLSRNNSPNLPENRSLVCTIKLTPKGSQLHNDKQSRGASATSSFHTLKIHWNRRHMAALHCCHSCGQSCWDPKTTVKATSCTSFPKEDSLSFLAMRIHVIKPALEQLSHPHCNHSMS